MALSCNDVCDAVMAKLRLPEFRFRDNEEHSDVLDARDRVHLELDDGKLPIDCKEQQARYAQNR